MTPDSLTSGAPKRPRWPLWLTAFVAIGLVALFTVLRSGGDDETAPQPVARPAPKPAPKPEPKPVEIPPKPSTGRDWPLYGNGPQRTRHMRGVSLKPPF